MKAVLRYLPTIIVLMVILYGTLASHPVMADDLPPIPYLDKLIHAVMMGGLLGAFVFDWQRAHRCTHIPKSLLWRAWICVALFSVADEIAQGALKNGRSSDPIDFVADLFGAFCAIYLAPPAVRYVLGLKNSTPPHRK